MLRGLFVTGTDTNAGKTVASAALVHRLRQIGPMGYWKPIQTGIEQDDDTAEVRRLADCRDDELLAAGIRLPRPVSPHLAARWSGITIRLDDLTELLRRSLGSRRWIIEGAGGALVPINETELMTDLMRALALPVIVAARSTLGTINHTLLTIEALQSRSLCVAGVVMIGEKNPENRAAIEHYGDVAVLGEMPVLKPLNSSTLGEWAAAELDPQNRLQELLR
jgi:dethiobiotin synthetase